MTADVDSGGWSGFDPEAWRSRISIASIPNVKERVEEVLSWDTGPEYPHGSPPGDARRLDRAGRDDLELATDEDWQAFWEDGGLA